MLQKPKWVKWMDAFAVGCAGTGSLFFFCSRTHCTVASRRVTDISLKSVTTEHQPLAFLTLRPSASVRAPPPNWVEDKTLPWQLLCAGPGARNCFFAHTSPSRSVHYSTPPRALRVLFCRLVSSFALFLCSLSIKSFPSFMSPLSLFSLHCQAGSLKSSLQSYHIGICYQNGDTPSKQFGAFN